MIISYMSKTGVYHEKNNIENQDFITHAENGRFAVIALADGVSACKYSAKGAEIACKTAAEILLGHGERIFSIDNYMTVSSIFLKIRQELEKISENNNISDYSSTLICILYDRIKNKIFYLNLGDGIVMGLNDSRCRVIAQPCDSRNGCYSTSLVNAEDFAESGIIDADGINSVMLCSDGAWNLMYNRGRLNSNIKQILTDRNFEALREILTEKNGFDDCSFISLNFSEFQEGKKNNYGYNTTDKPDRFTADKSAGRKQRVPATRRCAETA